MQIDLHFKRAFVCGASQGIGRAVALELAHLGASVTLMARNENTLKEVKHQLHTSPSQDHHILVADSSNTSQLHSLVEAYAAEHHVHILVNNSGGPKAGPAGMASIAEFEQAFTQHLLANHIMAQAFFKSMKDAGFGRIVNIISTSVKAPLPNLGVSNTVRGAVANWAKTLANEWGSMGITVNNVLPGATQTERLSTIIGNKSNQSGKTTDAIAQEMLHEIPLNRFALPEEVANAVAFLCTPAAAYINGINLSVDGGRTPSL